LVRLAVPKGLRRRYGLHHIRFITGRCYRRLPLFASARAKNLFVKILGEVRDRCGFALVGTSSCRAPHLSRFSTGGTFFIRPNSAGGITYYFFGAAGFGCFIGGFGEVYAPLLLMNSSL
jgi:hypothetical protein